MLGVKQAYQSEKHPIQACPVSVPLRGVRRETVFVMLQARQDDCVVSVPLRGVRRETDLRNVLATLDGMTQLVSVPLRGVRRETLQNRRSIQFSNFVSVPLRGVRHETGSQISLSS